MSPDAITSYDIRGIFSHTIHADDFYDIAYTLGKKALQKYGSHVRIVLGRDMRLQAQACYQKARLGLYDAGIIVVELGVATTPMLLGALHKKVGQYGMMITASHNPKEYIGCKLYHGTQSIAGSQLQQLLQQQYTVSPEKQKRLSIHKDPTHYVLHIAEKLQGLRIVCDVTASALQPYIKRLFQSYDIQVMYVTDEDRGYDPTTPRVLQKAVQTGAYDCGVAFDGDGDRVVFVFPSGTIMQGDAMAALFAWHHMKEFGNARCVLDQKMSPMLQQWLENQGIVVTIAQTGCMNIKRALQETQAHCGGEMSGHYFFTGDHPGYDDAWYAMLQGLRMIQQYGATYLQQLLPELFESSEFRITISREQGYRLAHKLYTVFGFGEFQEDLLVGARYLAENGQWIMLRFSQTEPKLCVRFGAPNKEHYNRMCAYAQQSFALFAGGEGL